MTWVFMNGMANDHFRGKIMRRRVKKLCWESACALATPACLVTCRAAAVCSSNCFHDPRPEVRSALRSSRMGLALVEFVFVCQLFCSYHTC